MLGIEHTDDDHESDIVGKNSLWHLRSIKMINDNNYLHQEKISLYTNKSDLVNPDSIIQKP